MHSRLQNQSLIWAFYFFFSKAVSTRSSKDPFQLSVYPPRDVSKPKSQALFLELRGVTSINHFVFPAATIGIYLIAKQGFARANLHGESSKKNRRQWDLHQKAGVFLGGISPSPLHLSKLFRLCRLWAGSWIKPSVMEVEEGRGLFVAKRERGTQCGGGCWCVCMGWIYIHIYIYLCVRMHVYKRVCIRLSFLPLESQRFNAPFPFPMEK